MHTLGVCGTREHQLTHQSAPRQKKVENQGQEPALGVSSKVYRSQNSNHCHLVTLQAKQASVGLMSFRTIYIPPQSGRDVRLADHHLEDAPPPAW